MQFLLFCCLLFVGFVVFCCFYMFFFGFFYLFLICNSVLHVTSYTCKCCNKLLTDSTPAMNRSRRVLSTSAGVILGWLNNEYSRFGCSRYSSSLPSAFTFSKVDTAFLISTWNTLKENINDVLYFCGYFCGVGNHS